MEGMVHHYRPFGKNVNANVFEVHIVKLCVEEGRCGALASAHHELLPLLRTERRSTLFAAGGIQLYEAVGVTLAS
jgi:hypothetical protein